tara:strand:+ start:1725 stop:2423 length:699 start_codon:yes stop_codon:yes gene_type:complete
MDLLVKFPTRGRCDRFFTVLDSFVEKQSGDHNCHYLVSCDNDDETMNNPETIKRLESYDNLSYYFDDRAGKIGSVNRDMDKAPNYDILMQPADDWLALVNGWDDRIVEEMDVMFDDGDGVVWFFDGHNREIDTLCIMGKPYYERFNYIYYPEYITFWADTEFTAVADLLGRLSFSPDVLFEHQHPDWLHSHGYDGQKQGYDQLYIDNDKQEDRDFDERLFHERKARDFDLKL